MDVPNKHTNNLYVSRCGGKAAPAPAASEAQPWLPAEGAANSRDAGFRPLGETADAIVLDLIGDGSQP